MAGDAQVWERIRRGEAQAFDCLYREMGRRLIGFLRRILGDGQAAEDLMQETFTEIWRSPNGFTAERGTLRAYMFGVARKRAADWRRKRGTENRNEIEEGSQWKTETVSLVGDAFEKLPEDQRSLLWLREVEGQSYAELAQILEIPLGTVRSRLFAAREELRKVWHSAPPVKKEGA